MSGAGVRLVRYADDFVILTRDRPKAEDALAAVDGVSDPALVRGLAGQDRFLARKAIVDALEALGLDEERIDELTAEVFASLDAGEES